VSERQVQLGQGGQAARPDPLADVQVVPRHPPAETVRKRVARRRDDHQTRSREGAGERLQDGPRVPGRAETEALSALPQKLLHCRLQQPKETCLEQREQGRFVHRAVSRLEVLLLHSYRASQRGPAPTALPRPLCNRVGLRGL